MSNGRSDDERSPDDTNTKNVNPLVDQKPKRDRPYLIVLAGTSMGVMHLIDKEITTVGRAEKANLRIIDDGISREHSRVIREQDRIVLEDLGSTNGTYCNGVRVTRQALSEGDKIMIGTSTILKFTFHDQIDEVFQQQLTESALRDPLTKTYNKKFFLDRIQSEFTYAERHRLSLALLFLDVDRFKSINDTHGHPVGDFVLQELASLMSKSLRNEDVLARYGGEEFAVVCRGLDLAPATLLAERIRRGVERHKFEMGGKVIPVTVSVGVARAPDVRLRTAAELVVAADESMYLAKRSGRNRVCAQAPLSPDEETTGIIDRK
ncbi:MAG: GGDEF domain-containing protein [Pseudomonadota bacterium]